MRHTSAKREQLCSGIRLVTEYVPSLHSATVGVAIETGSREDPLYRKGLAHLVEHILVRKGRTVMARLDSLGGWFDAYTERDFSLFYIRVLGQHVSEAVHILSKLITERRITDEDCAQEKRVVLSEIELYQQDYLQMCQQAIIESMWRGHPLGSPILGDVPSINRIKSCDVIEFLNKNYVPENVIVSAVGGARSQAGIRTLVEDAFNMTSTTRSEAGDASISVPVTRIGHVHLGGNDHSNLVYYSVGMNSLCRTDPDRVVLFALSSLLGEGSYSRLFRRLRTDAGRVYDIQSSYQLFSEGGVLTISGMVNGRSFPAVINGIEVELEDIRTKAPTRHELGIVQNRLRSSLLFNLENPELRMVRLAKLENWFGRTFDIEEEFEMIQDVSPRGIRDLAVRLVSDGVNLCTVGQHNSLKGANLATLGNCR